MSQLQESSNLRRLPLLKGSHRISTSTLPELVQETFHALGYHTVEQVLSVLQLFGHELDERLGLPVSQIIAEQFAGIAPPQAPFAVRSARYRHGARLRQPAQAILPAALPPPPATAAALPSANPGDADVNLIPEMQAIRDQAYRGTCVGFASVACLEHALFKSRRDQIALSEQFAYWNDKQHDGISNQPGTFLEYAMPLLQTDGTCLDNTWPYVRNDIAGNEGQDPPPAGAATEALSYRATAVNMLDCADISQIKAELDQGRCVAVAVAYFRDSWETDEIRNSGRVTLPFPGTVTHEGHAVCLVGYQDLPDDAPNGYGRFLLRNSWNGYWAVAGEFGVGYGSMPYSYLTTYGHEAYSLE
ncbi:hypothetical protein HDF16_000142 [Granulicella aggregans]|uniref:Peptidase C1A papain C-terminal domain-containing protein n=1 Tax=Granulicella aggregans TaxID=474949 RepID=A0A7W8E164_9BACT|nr:C1 family peptidase [Granulicella aggregans]MBB5055473.1 hypothetical protein [Granulicella aggregans]